MDKLKFLLIAAIAACLIFWFSKRSKANAPTVLAVTSTPVANTMITNYDSVWDYKLENGVWFTRRKADAASGVWLNMKTSLSNDAYNLAISRLTAFLAKK